MSEGADRRSRLRENDWLPTRLEDDSCQVDRDRDPRLTVAPESPTLDVDGAGRGEPILAYLYLRRDASVHTRAVLADHVRAFAWREGYNLAGMLLAAEDGSTDTSVGEGSVMDELLSLRELVEQLEVTCARKVLVVGPARQALVLLHRMRGIQILTLAHVRPLRLDRWGAEPDPSDEEGSLR